MACTRLFDALWLMCCIFLCRDDLAQPETFKCYVGNLDYNVTEEDLVAFALNEASLTVGVELANVHLVRDKATGRTRGL